MIWTFALLAAALAFILGSVIEERSPAPIAPGARGARGSLVALTLAGAITLSLGVAVRQLAGPLAPAGVRATPTAGAGAKWLPPLSAARPAILPSTPTLDAGNPVATPTTVPPTTPRVGPVAIATPMVSTAPTAGPAESLATVRQRVLDAEAALQRGEITATIDYGNGTCSIVEMRFDRGDARREPRLYSRSTFQGLTGIVTVERLADGTRTWERQLPGDWRLSAAPEGLWGQLSRYLPPLESIATSNSARDGMFVTLRWYDPARDADAELLVDSATGIPVSYSEKGRSTALPLVVRYRAWNAPVVITPPAPGDGGRGAGEDGR